MSLLFVDTAGKNNYSATDIMEVIFDMEDTQTEPNMDIEVKANTTQTASHSKTTSNLVSRTSSVAAGKLFFKCLHHSKHRSVNSVSYTELAKEFRMVFSYLIST